MKRTFTLIAAAAALLLLQGCIVTNEEHTTVAGQSFDEIVAMRRSVRDYKEGTTITEAQVRNLIAKQGDLLKEGVAITGDSYDNQIQYEFVAFKEMKPKMMQEAIENAQVTAEQFAKNSNSKLNKIVSADQGQFSIDDRDQYTPWIKKVRVVTTVTYSLDD